MNEYKCLEKQRFDLNEFSLIPLRSEDIQKIRVWRNGQMKILRQSEFITEEKQLLYYENQIVPTFNAEQPKQFLFSFLKNNECIGYGGLVHINWIDRNAEISFIMDTVLEQDFFEIHWSNYLSLIEKVAFEELKFHKIFTYAFDLRPHLYPMLIKNGFEEDARLKEHCCFEGKFIDVLIHAKYENNFSKSH